MKQLVNLFTVDFMKKRWVEVEDAKTFVEIWLNEQIRASKETMETMTNDMTLLKENKEEL